MQYNKVNAGSGAQWLLDALAILRRYPAQLLVIGLLYGVLSSIPFLSLLVGALAVVLAAGMLLAVAEADHGRAPAVGMLFAGFTSGKVGRLLVLLLVAVAFLLLMSLALVAMIGGEGVSLMQQIIASTPEGGQPDPSLIMQLPAGRLLGWVLLMLVLGLLVWLYTFFYMPLVMFNDLGVGQAFRHAIRASARNLPALLVYMVVSIIFSVMVMLATVVVSSLLGLVIGAVWAGTIAGVLMTAVMVPVAAGSTYYAWKQVFAVAAASPVAPPAHDRLEV